MGERISKIIQVIGVATIITDMIGLGEIRKFDASLKSQISSTVLLQFLQPNCNCHTSIFRHNRLKNLLNR
jgi:hypothetical protein